MINAGALARTSVGALLSVAACEKPFLHHVNQRQPPLTSLPPTLAWHDPPYFGASCRLVVPGDTALGDGAFASASGAIGKSSGSVAADDRGMSGVVDDLTPGVFATSWTVEDSLGASATLSRDLRLTYLVGARLDVPHPPNVASGEYTMEGSQALSPGCATCTGVRGSVSAGNSHGCVVAANGRLQCWGMNYMSQVGSGAATEYANPQKVCGGAAGACTQDRTDTVVTTGSDELVNWSCTADGAAAYCWGANTYGQLGSGSTADAFLPVQVCDGASCGSLAGVTAMATGYWHTCALLSGGTVKCWGDNYFGQLGLGTLITTESDVAVPVCAASAVWNGTICDSGGSDTPLSGVTAVAAGRGHTCLLVGGEVQCVGDNGWGQLGQATLASTTVPTPVCTSGDWTGSACSGGPTLTGMSGIVAGKYFSCAYNAAGDVWCWGDNTAGELGDGTFVNANNPVQVCAAGAQPSCTALTGVTRLAAGTEHVCALVNQNVWCWGYGNYGQLGGGSVVASVNHPSLVCATGTWNGTDCRDAGSPSQLGGVLEVFAGGTSSCARTASNLLCWGENSYGQVGDGQAGPTRVNPSPTCATGTGGTCTPLATVSTMALTDRHACAVAGGIVECWGDTRFGAVGVGDVDPVFHPTEVCSSGVARTCTPLGNVRAVSAGDEHTCAVLGDGSVRCWGLGTDGRLGTGDGASHANPAAVCASGSGAGCPPLGGAVAVSAGFDHTCVVSGAGQVLCWGRNNCGQLGDGLRIDCQDTTQSRPQPAPVCALGSSGPGCTPMTGLVDVVAGTWTTCVTTAAGRVLCFGYGEEGQLGNGDSGAGTGPPWKFSAQPVEVQTDRAGNPPLADVVALAGGITHVCALTRVGEVWCWGNGESGALGNGQASGVFSRATPVCATSSGDSCPRLTGVVAIAAAEAYTCALLASGGVTCWGNGILGTLGSIGDLGGGSFGAIRDVYNPVPVCAADPTTTCDAACGGLMSNAVAIAAGDTFACALGSDDAVRCWGRGLRGQLANGGTSSCLPTPACASGSGDCGGNVLSQLALRQCDLYGVEVVP